MSMGDHWREVIASLTGSLQRRVQVDENGAHLHSTGQRAQHSTVHQALLDSRLPQERAANAQQPARAAPSCPPASLARAAAYCSTAHSTLFGAQMPTRSLRCNGGRRT